MEYNRFNKLKIIFSLRWTAIFMPMAHAAVLSDSNGGRPWQVEAVVGIFENILTEEIYYKRASSKTLARGQKEALYGYCIRICNDVKRLMLGDGQIEPCLDCPEKGKIMGEIMKFQGGAMEAMRKGPKPHEARDKLCTNLEKVTKKLGVDLGFTPKISPTFCGALSIAGVSDSGYDGFSSRIKYYAKGKGKGGKLLYDIIGIPGKIDTKDMYYRGASYRMGEDAAYLSVAINGKIWMNHVMYKRCIVSACKEYEAGCRKIGIKDKLPIGYEKDFTYVKEYIKHTSDCIVSDLVPYFQVGFLVADIFLHYNQDCSEFFRKLNRYRHFIGEGSIRDLKSIVLSFARGLIPLAIFRKNWYSIRDKIKIDMLSEGDASKIKVIVDSIPRFKRSYYKAHYPVHRFSVLLLYMVLVMFIFYVIYRNIYIYNRFYFLEGVV